MLRSGKMVWDGTIGAFKGRQMLLNAPVLNKGIHANEHTGENEDNGKEIAYHRGTIRGYKA